MSSPDMQSNPQRSERSPSLEDLTSNEAQEIRNKYLVENRVAIVGGLRTPFVKAGGAFSDYSFLDMGSHVVNNLIAKMKLDPKEVNELVFGTVLLDPRMPNAAREIVLRSDLPKSIGAHFVSNNCITGLVAIDMLAHHIATGQAKIGIAAGSESMSNPALTLSPEAEKFWLNLSRSKGFFSKLGALAAFRPKFAIPNAPSPKEPSTGLTMGEHCEITAKELGISRLRQDEIALRSHQNALAAREIHARNIVPFGGIDSDKLVRGDTSMEALAKLKTIYDNSAAGTITAGNASPLTDGAAAICLMAEAEARRQNREILGYISGMEFAAIDPDDGLLMAPCLAVPRLLQRQGVSAQDVGVYEIHEAFGAQVAANLQVWEKGWEKYGIPAIGKIPDEKINLHGGSIAIGHPFAATGGRVVMSLLNAMNEAGVEDGIASVCAAGAVAYAMRITKK